MKYFDEYKNLVDSHHIVVGKWIKLAMKRIERYRQQYIFKQDEADRRISFIENETSNTKGSHERLKLALPQKVWLETAWGFYENAKVIKINPDTMQEYQATEERRLIHQVPIEMGRGNGKTTLGSAIGETGLIIDGEYGADVQLLAYDRHQAGFLFNASRAMLNAEGTLLNELTQADQLSSTKQGLLFRPTNSLMQIVTSDYDSLDGTNAHYNIFDEVHTYDDDFIKVVNDGSARKRKNWMTWYLTTNGTKRDKVFDKYLKIWKLILEDKIDNDSIMPFLYELNSVDEIHDSRNWQMANPMLGINVDKSSIQKDIKMSKNDPVQQAELMAKTFNLPINNYLAYFSNDEAKGNAAEFDPGLFIGSLKSPAMAVMGFDLSGVDDLTSISFMVKDDNHYHFLNKKYVPRASLKRYPKAQQDQYLKWETDGILTIHDYPINDPDFIFKDLMTYISENNINPVCIGYDPWGTTGNAEPELVKSFTDTYGPIAYSVQQSTRILSPAMKQFKALLLAGKIHFDDPVTTWNMANVMAKIDANGNVFPNKAKARDKIDIFLSMLDSYIAYQSHKDELYTYFEYNQKGGE